MLFNSLKKLFLSVKAVFLFLPSLEFNDDKKMTKNEKELELTENGKFMMSGIGTQKPFLSPSKKPVLVSLY